MRAVIQRVQSAAVRVNGNPVPLLPWQPACMDISKFIQSEKNKIEIEVMGKTTNGNDFIMAAKTDGIYAHMVTIN